MTNTPGANAEAVAELAIGFMFALASLHLPSTAGTRDLVDRDLLRRMRVGSYLINTARGELVVEDDLLSALERGHLGGAALDTLGVEPPPVDHPLLRRDDVLVTPHMGAHTAEAARAMGRLALRDLLAVLAGRPPHHPVIV